MNQQNQKVDFFRILGTVTAQLDGRPIALPRRQVRYVLALLLLEVGQPVTADRLISLLWPERRPQDARSTLQTTVARLRSTLGPAGSVRLDRVGDGYALLVDPDQVDAHRFMRLVGRAREAEDPTQRAALAHEALELWRGPALADVASEQVRVRLCAALEQTRRQALDIRVSAELRLGAHERLVGELADLNRQNPLDEQIVAHLMVALYRSGRRGEALAAYRRLRADIVDQLGLDPGPALRELEAAILRADASLDLDHDDEGSRTARGRPVPAQLPATTPDFVGRDGELALLDNHLAGLAAAGSPLTFVVCGPGGVGKTALAVRWSRRVSAEFPDGQLFANLRGYDIGEPARPIEVLAIFLRSLGLDPARVPLDVDEATALYRTLVASRRLLVLLDNVRSVDQVRPLLPTSPGSVVVVTSRDRLTGLAARDGARRLRLGVLSPADSAELLARVLPGRSTSEPEGVVELARACGHLPLALRIAAAQLADDPHRTVAAHVAALRRDHLAALYIDDDESSLVRVTFQHSYVPLSAPAQELFRLAGLLTGPDFDVMAAAALAGRSTADTSRLLSVLSGAHLIESACAGRFTMHDLLRWYAQERAAEQDSPAAKAAARQRLHEHYLSHMDAAARQLYPQMLRLPIPALPAHEFDDHVSARAWLDAERSNLLAATLLAAELGSAPMTWLLADAQRGYFWLTQNYVDWSAAAEAGLATAIAAGDERAQAACHLSLGLANLCTSNYPVAGEHIERARMLSEQAGWREGAAAALGSLGSLYLEWGRLDLAAEAYGAALEVNTALGRRAAAATNLGNLAVVHMERGRLAQAALESTTALEFQRSEGILLGQAITLGNLGEVYRWLGDFDGALTCLTESLALRRQLGSRQGEAVDLAILAAVHRDAGQLRLALPLAEQAVAIITGISDPTAESEIRAVYASVLLELGLKADAIREYTNAHGLAASIGSNYLETTSTIGLAAAQHARGLTEAARAHAQRGLDLARSGGYRVLEGLAATVLAEIELSLGAVTRARARVSQALAVHHEVGHLRGVERARSLLERIPAKP